MKLLTLLNKEEIHLTKNKKIIRAEEFSQLLEASEIVKLTEENAKTYVKEYKKKCQKVRAKAKEEGYQEGLTELNRQILSLENKVKHVRQEMMKSILPLAMKAAKRIVGRELELKPDSIVDIVLQGIKPVKEAQRIKIFVAKDDLKHLEEKKPEIKQQLEHAEMFAIEEREDLAQGDCIIETEGGIINATLENQWRALEAAFETYLKQNP